MNSETGQSVIRAMKKSESNQLKVLLIIQTYSEYGNRFLQGISDYADKHSRWIFHRTDPSSFYKNVRVKQSAFLSSVLPKWQPDGIITCNPEVTKKLSGSGTPTIVFLDSMNPLNGDNSFPKVVLDNQAIGQIAAQEFMKRGYKNYAYWEMGIDSKISKIRIQAYRNTVLSQGHDLFVYEPIRSGPSNSWEKEQLRTIQWLKSLPKPVGIFVFDDNNGRDLIEATKAVNIPIPEQVAVLGVGNDKLICNFCTPPLSSIVLDNKTAGYEAAELLDRLMLGDPVQNHSIEIKPLKVYTRQSTDILAVRDDDVNLALSFIHQNCQADINVQDVVKAAAISRRRLQEKFCGILGRTISDEIARVRTEQISQMLLNTDLTIKQIALKFGYNGLSHISRFFKRQTGFPPVEYRKKYGRA